MHDALIIRVGERVSSEHFVKVSNETKGCMWTYSPVAMGLPRENQDMLWLSHWNFRDDELEGGEELRVSVNSGLWAKEFAIQLVYEEENKGKGVGSNGEDIVTLPWNQNVVEAGDVPGSVSASKYEMWKGKYFLCNHRYRIHQAQFRRCQANSAYGDYSYKPEASFYLTNFLFTHEVDISEKKVDRSGRTRVGPCRSAPSVLI
ncbi:unnamed protein product [Prunus brigantina]